MYKLIASDIDGTLLNSKNMLTPKTVEAIKSLKSKGVYFVLCTGRPVQGVYDIYDQLELDSPVITYNGAVVLLSKTGPVIFEKSLTPYDTGFIIKKGEALGTNMAIWCDSRLYTNRFDERSSEYSLISGIDPVIYNHESIIFQKGATKVVFHDTVEKIKNFEKELKPLLSENALCHTSRPYFLEFVNSGVSKSLAMEKLGEHLGIMRDEMIAIGDGFNDLSMIEYAGLGIAMGNAEDEVREKAGFVTHSCDEDGIAYAINKFIHGIIK
jgi:Cof subfamily protein (haloacid dehalogenase superfamily)